MTRSEIKAAFRVQNPEVTDRVIADPALDSMLLVGDKEVCAKTRCIVSDYTWTAVINEQSWDIVNKIPTFFAIDDFPGGGVVFNGKPLDLTTIAQLDQEYPTWRSRSAGVPKSYWIRGKKLWFDRPVSAADDIQVYYAAISDDFNADDILPFNQLTPLEPYHNALVLYLTSRAKSKGGKPGEAQLAKQEYDDHIRWMAKEVASSKKGIINYAPRG